jgi:hypothetical protein
VCNKLTELLHHLLYSDSQCNMMYDMIILKESWLNLNVPDSILDWINTVLRCDRCLYRAGGGVCSETS